MADHPTHEDFAALTEQVHATAAELTACRHVLTLTLGELAKLQQDPGRFIMDVTEFVQSLVDKANMSREMHGKVSKHLASMQRQAMESQGVRGRDEKS